MIVGSLSVRLLVREARSLKDKRQVVRSIKDRLRNEFNVSVAEVSAEDNRQLAALGFAMIATESQTIKKSFGAIVERLRHHPVAELLDYEMETW